MAEAMADIEEGRPTGWLTNLRSAWARKAEERSTRVVTVPHRHDQKLRDRLGEQHFRGNKTTTTKYNLITFLPKSLFEQYRPWTTFLPLGIVLGVAMIKEAVEDWKRHRQDVEVNNRDVMVFDGPQNKFVQRQWKDVRVGDIITVNKDEYFPTDLLFLTAETEEGLCYIETMNLDGETNLKIKKAMDETKGLREASMGSLHASVHCEPPNSRLYQFTGNLEIGPPFVQEVQTLPIGPSCILLRGCSLRNTPRIFGLVIYAGHDTKIFMNATKAPSKRSAIERRVDSIIFCMFALLFTMCVTGCTYYAIWTKNNMANHWYLGDWGNNYVPNEYNADKPALVGATNFVTAFILYGYLIPISLYVSMEMVKIVQSMLFIAADRDMYHAESDTPAVARTSNLNEELGMVTTVLSDKTGTLTRNVMEFFKCSVGGVAYGSGITEIERANAQRKGIVLPAQVEDTPYREAFFNFYDDRLMDTEWAEQANRQITEEFFRLLALCNTVIPDGPPIPDKMRYEAESPDESALVVAAKVFGFFFFKRSNTTMWLRERLPEGEREVEYEVLNILEFNSTRKRMSVIVRTPEDRIILYCKGADTVIYERLDNSHPLNAQLKEVTLGHMEDFGSAGLRTLCLSYAELDRTFYDEWQERFITAKTSLEDRDAKVEAVGEEIEKNLILLGCTAIEDKLQQGVPECIRTLARAGIKLWVLTGDKMETAINIAYACSLITDEMTQFQVTGATEELDMLEANHKWDEAARLAHERINSQLNKVSKLQKEDAAEGRGSVQYALVIDGKALLYALSPRLKNLFLEVAVRCKAVVCCRVSPLQKAQVTALVKGRGDITLAIGDGANDVGMIQKAHIGVGISGQEGMQAVMASDFAIAQFRFLTPLLLVHGRLSYKRITRMINFFFYKNLLFGVTIFTFNAFALFSGQPIYNDFYMTLFNVVFTVAGPLAVGWFDKDVDKEWGLRYPHLYLEGQRNIYFNVRAILGWLATALLHAGLIMSFVLLGASASDIDRPGGNAWTLYSNGVLMFTIVVMTVHFQLAVILDQWTWLHHLSIWGSIVLWFLFMYIFGEFPITLSGDLYMLMKGVVSNQAAFWLFLLLLPPLCAMLTFFYKQMERHLRPAQYQIVQEIAKREARGELTDNPDKARHRSVMQKATRLLSRVQHNHASSAKRSSGGGDGSSPNGLQVHRGGHKRTYSGYVPSYDSRSRVFDAAELRDAALQAGYSIGGQPSVDRPSPLQLTGRRPSQQLQSRSSDAAMNPVLQSLDREFVKEPRRHKRSISVDTTSSASWQDAVFSAPSHGLTGVGNGAPAPQNGTRPHSPFADVAAPAATASAPSNMPAAPTTRNIASGSASRPGQGSEAVPPVASVGEAKVEKTGKGSSRLGLGGGRASGADAAGVQLPVRPSRGTGSLSDAGAPPDGGSSSGGAP